MGIRYHPGLSGLGFGLMTDSSRQPLRIGMTGGIGSGKSTAAALFKALDVPVLDADELTRELTEPGQPALETIRQTFGTAVIDADGRLSRRALRERVFTDDNQRRQLEAILHPLVYAELNRRTGALKTAYTIWVVPLLLETGASDKVDRVLVIDCPEELQLQRASQRDEQDKEAIRRIMAQQISRQQRLEQADDILVNDADSVSLEQQIQHLHKRYLKLAVQNQKTLAHRFLGKRQL